MTCINLDPGDPESWIARGRHPEDAAVIAAAWRTFPDLSPDASLEERQARSRARVEAMRPVHAAMVRRVDSERQAKNFAFVEARLTTGGGDDRDVAILRARDVHGHDWDSAVHYASGWYAAHAGWKHRGPSADRNGHAHANHHAAYDLGFADAGGQREDIFDAARRANLAGERKSNQPPALIPERRARQLPSAWLRPTDRPRPIAWAKRLLVIGDCIAPRAITAVPAIELFDNRQFQALQAHPGLRDAAVVVLSAEHGFVSGHVPLAPYSTAMTSKRAAALASNPQEQAKLADLLAGRDVEDILLVASGNHLAVIEAHHRALPLCRHMAATSDQLIVHKTHLETWLARGVPTATSRGAGHIRWGRVHKGLTGKLAELTARYTGPVAPKGHRIRVEIAGGDLAIGYIDPSGFSLDPEITVSSKAKIRAAMATALRAFGGAVRF